MDLGTRVPGRGAAALAALALACALGATAGCAGTAASRAEAERAACALLGHALDGAGGGAQREPVAELLRALRERHAELRPWVERGALVPDDAAGLRLADDASLHPFERMRLAALLAADRADRDTLARLAVAGGSIAVTPRELAAALARLVASWHRGTLAMDCR
jgi:hypothetical protein